jgi:hypothetical protein
MLVIEKGKQEKPHDELIGNKSFPIPEAKEIWADKPMLLKIKPHLIRLAESILRYF